MIKLFTKEREKGNSITGTCKLAKVSYTSYYEWMQIGKDIESKFNLNNNLDLTQYSEYQISCLNFLLAVREAEGKCESKSVDVVQTIRDHGEVEHCRLKAALATLKALNPDVWADKPQVQINQQFNAITASDRILDESRVQAMIADAVAKRLPDNTGADERRRIQADVRQSIDVDVEDVEYSLDTPAKTAEGKAG